MHDKITTTTKCLFFLPDMLIYNKYRIFESTSTVHTGIIVVMICNTTFLFVSEIIISIDSLLQIFRFRVNHEMHTF